MYWTTSKARPLRRGIAADAAAVVKTRRLLRGSGAAVMFGGCAFYEPGHAKIRNAGCDRDSVRDRDLGVRFVRRLT